MNRRILLVDDEQAVLDSLYRQLCFDFDISIADSGRKALQVMETSPKFAVILSDRRMPAMDGISFLTRAKAISADTVRLMLTGNADQKTAVDALNDGCIFRFMNKPCGIDVIKNSLQAGLDQFQLITAEKDLLSRTLLDSTKLLTELLSVTDPVAYGRSSRTCRWSRQCAVKLQLDKPWEVELAAAFSQIGSLATPDVSNDSNRDDPLLLDVSQRLVAEIPRLETVAEIIAFDLNSTNDGESALRQEIRLNAQVFRGTLAIDRLLTDESLTAIMAFKQLRDTETFCQQVLDALESVILSELNAKCESVAVHSLPENAILAEDLYSDEGVLLLSKGQQLVPPLCERLLDYWESGRLTASVSILSQETS